jgi:hypothetical protein
MVLGCDQLVGPRALAWDVQVNNFALVVLHFDSTFDKVSATNGILVHTAAIVPFYYVKCIVV